MQENKEIKMHIFSGCSFDFNYEQCMNELPSPLLVAFGDIRVSVNVQYANLSSETQLSCNALKGTSTLTTE